MKILHGRFICAKPGVSLGRYAGKADLLKMFKQIIESRQVVRTFCGNDHRRHGNHARVDEESSAPGVP